MNTTPASPAIAGSFRSASRSIAAAIVLLSVLVLAGRLAQRALPPTALPEPIMFTTGSAVLFFLAGPSLLLQTIRTDHRWRRHAAASAVGVMALAATAWGARLSDVVGRPGTVLAFAADLLISPQSCLAFLLIGVALALLDWEARRGAKPAQPIALVAAAIALVPVLGYLYGVAPLYAVADHPDVPIHEPLALLLLAAAVLLARPESGLIGIATHETPGGFLVRWMPAAVLALPLALGWIALKGHRLGWYGTAPAIAVLVLATTTFFLLLIFRLARSLDRTDLHRRHAENQLRLRARQRAGVAELAQRALSGLPVAALASDAVRLAVNGLEVEAGEFVEVQNDGTTMAIRSAIGWDGDDAFPVLTGAVSLQDYVLDSDEPVIVDDLERDRRLRDSRLTARGITSALVVIVRGASRAYGTLATYSSRPGAFSRDDLPLLQTVAGILAAAHDYRAGEDARRLSEEKFSIVFRSSPDAIAVSRLSDGRLVDVNDSFLQMTGFTHDEVLQRSVGELGLWLDSPAQPAASAEGPVPVRNLEAQFRTKAGEVRVGLCSTEIITLGGEPCVLTVVRDISDRREAQAAIQEANERLARWVNELEIRSREISLLNDMGDLLQTCLTPAEACTVVVHFAQQLLPGSSGAVCMIRDTGGLLEGVAVWGDLSGDEVVFAPHECWALRRGRPHLVHDPGVAPICAHLRRPVTAVSLCVPMMAQGETLGVLHVRDTGGVPVGETTGARLTESKERLVVAVAEHVALALANLRLRETLRSQSVRDPLTGLYNRRYMEESLERELLRARRAARSVGLILMDLDRFKAVNDLHGHDAGDELLKAVGRLLRRQLRAGDVACRYGGEEFLFVLPETALPAARDRAEELRRAVRSLTVWHGGRTLDPVSASAGVVTFPEDGADATDLLRAADAALYRAKAQGGDRIEAGRVDPHGLRPEPPTDQQSPGIDQG
jgi:diguanylate cyclase (GGDEF)-like protein/PAS domain S-box-containing protein